MEGEFPQAPSAVKRCGASHSVMVLTESMPPPKWAVTEPPTRPSISVGTNHAPTPGPVAIACQTCSGVPGTSTSTCTERRPFASFLTLILLQSPCFLEVSFLAVTDVPLERGGVSVRPGRRRHDNGPRVE